MPAYSVTLPGSKTAVITGTRPFVKLTTGGPHGAVSIVDATGAEANPQIGDETAETVFSHTVTAEALADDIVEAANNSPVVTVAAAIAGTAQVGQTLTASATFTGTAAPTKTYQWYAGGVAIAGATASTLVLAIGQLGALITVTVTGTNTHGVATSTSAATAAVVAA